MTSRTATGAGLGGSACLLRFMVVVDERCAGGAFLGVTTALPLCPECAELRCYMPVVLAQFSLRRSVCIQLSSTCLAISLRQIWPLP